MSSLYVMDVLVIRHGCPRYTSWMSSLYARYTIGVMDVLVIGVVIGVGEIPDDQEVLQFAMGREQAAMEQYRDLAESTGPGPIKDLFRYLADEETQHKLELEKLYYEVIHSGGV